MALDHGTKRIGVAFCDPGETLASPFAVWPNQGETTVARLAALAREESAEGILVGLPRHKDGNESATAPAARALAESLRSAIRPSLPVVLWGEHLTTVEADRRMAEAGTRREARAERRDAVAAAIMLEEFIASRRGRGIRTDASGT